MNRWRFDYHLRESATITRRELELFSIFPERPYAQTRLMIAMIIHGPHELQTACVLEVRKIVRTVAWDGTASGVAHWLTAFAEACNGIVPAIVAGTTMDAQHPGMQLQVSLAGICSDDRGTLVAFRRGDFAVRVGSNVRLAPEVDTRVTFLSGGILTQSFPANPFSDTDFIWIDSADEEVSIQSGAAASEEPAISIKAVPQQ